MTRFPRCFWWQSRTNEVNRTHTVFTIFPRLSKAMPGVRSRGVENMSRHVSGVVPIEPPKFVAPSHQPTNARKMYQVCNYLVTQQLTCSAWLFLLLGEDGCLYSRGRMVVWSLGGPAGCRSLERCSGIITPKI